MLSMMTDFRCHSDQVVGPDVWANTHLDVAVTELCQTVLCYCKEIPEATHLKRQKVDF